MIACPKKIVVVLGMHRSGTSALSRGLRVLNVKLGDRLMPPNPEVNAKGFWEDIDLNALNIEMLAAVGSEWHCVAPIDVNDVEMLKGKGYLLRATDLLRQKIGNDEIFGFKDPRLAKLFPFWLEVFASCSCEVYCVLSLRHPLSVAKSLKKRDNLSPSVSYLLWAGHVLGSFIGSTGTKRCIVDYDNLVRLPSRELERIAKQLKFRVDETELLKFSNDFIDDALRHTTYEQDDLNLDYRCPPLVRDMYVELRKAAIDRPSLEAPGLKRKIEIWAEEFRRMTSILKFVDEQEHRIESLQAKELSNQSKLAQLDLELSQRISQIAALGDALAGRDHQIQELNKSLTKQFEDVETENRLLLVECDRKIDNLNRSVTEQSGQVGATINVLAERDRQIDALNCLLVEQANQLEAWSRLVIERNEKIETLGQSLAEQNNRADSLSSQLAERSRQFDDLDRKFAQTLEQLELTRRNLNETEAKVQDQTALLQERDRQIGELTEETVRRGEWALRLDRELVDAQTQFRRITRSNSWRLTLPLREARRWVSSPQQQIGRYATAGLGLAKRAYRKLPLSHETKLSHRGVLAKYFPKVLLATGSPPVTVPPSSQALTVDEKPLEEITHPTDFAASIDLATSPTPLVSVIIPVYGKVDYTLRCLQSIAEHLPQAKFEVIVVDDCSPDNSASVLAKAKGIRLVRNSQNLGFVRSCNAGAAEAKGEYLYFLNNDTRVTPGWLDELLRTFDEFPGTGLAGSKLLYPDGRLQEAGGIIWKDGSAWNFGRFQDPSLPIYNYAREVDYCSGASIMVPTKLFSDFGGFDELYVPAYCEDADLALKIRERGLRVVYQPMSVVVHYEGITSGTETTAGVKSHQVENSKKLLERWRSRLAQHQLNGEEIDRAKDRVAQGRCLLIDHCTPTPNQDAGSVTVLNFMLLLREMNFQVTFIPEDNFHYMADYTSALQRIGVEVLYAPFVTSVEQHLKESGSRYDLVFLFRPGVVERHIKPIRKACLKARVLFHTVDLHFLRMSREAVLNSDKKIAAAAEEMKERELKAIQSADASIVHSTAELDILKPLVPQSRLYVFPLIMDIRGTQKSFATRRDVVFVGGYQHTPNVDAVKYFVAEIMPILRLRLPGVRFFAVGSKPPAEIISLTSTDIVVAGFVENLDELLDKMRVSVAPLRYGAGIKGKIGTAMASGLPVVATSLASEGMSLTHGENILVADDPVAFADAIESLYMSDLLWSRLSKNGLMFAEQSWGGQAAARQLAEILRDLRISILRIPSKPVLYRTASTCSDRVAKHLANHSV